MHRFAWLISYSCKIENNTFNNTFTYIARRSKGPLCVFNCKIPDISYFLRPFQKNSTNPPPSSAHHWSLIFFSTPYLFEVNSFLIAITNSFKDSWLKKAKNNYVRTYVSSKESLTTITSITWDTPYFMCELLEFVPH